MKNFAVIFLILSLPMLLGSIIYMLYKLRKGATSGKRYASDWKSMKLILGKVFFAWLGTLSASMVIAIAILRLN